MRTQTTRLLDMIADGVISAQAVAEMALGYMSEDEVADMMQCNDILEDEDEDEPDCDDSDDGYALASAGHGTDEDYGSAEDTL